MNIEKYTERARGFIQSAQSLAMRDGHQQFSPLHMLKVLLDDGEDATADAGEISSTAGGADRSSTGGGSSSAPLASAPGDGRSITVVAAAAANVALKGSVNGRQLSLQYSMSIEPLIATRSASVPGSRRYLRVQVTVPKCFSTSF